MTLYRGLGSTNYTSTVQALTPTYCPSCPPSLPLAVMQAESSGNPNAVSPAGAIGLFQLMPATAASLGVNPSDPTANITGGLTYLQQLYNQFGNWNQALEAYNEGPGALQSQIAAGTTPVSAGYASGILAAAGIDDSSDSSDSSISDATSSLFDLSAIADLPDTTGLSWGTLALIGVGLLGVAWAVS
jgi:Transglycosylase SLT domain